MTWLLLVLAAAVLVVSVAVMVRVLLALDAMKAAADLVAIDLAVVQSRADSTTGPHGAKADAASGSPNGADDS